VRNFVPLYLSFIVLGINYMCKTLCNTHREIIFTVNKIKESSSLTNIKTLCNEVNSLTRKAVKLGQRMENRLHKYRSSIEDLGFKRVLKDEIN